MTRILIIGIKIIIMLSACNISKKYPLLKSYTNKELKEKTTRGFFYGHKLFKDTINKVKIKFNSSFTNKTKQIPTKKFKLISKTTLYKNLDSIKEFLIPICNEYTSTKYEFEYFVIYKIKKYYETKNYLIKKYGFKEFIWKDYRKVNKNLVMYWFFKHYSKEKHIDNIIMVYNIKTFESYLIWYNNNYLNKYKYSLKNINKEI